MALVLASVIKSIDSARIDMRDNELKRRGEITVRSESIRSKLIVFEAHDW